jgi:hypothetical protein
MIPGPRWAAALLILHRCRIKVGFITSHAFQSSGTKRFVRVLTGLSKVLFHTTIVFVPHSGPREYDHVTEELV